MPRKIAIVNPHALVKRQVGREAFTNRLDALADEIFFTEYAGHAGEIAQRFRDEAAVLMVTGGDGTLHDVIQHIDCACQSIVLIAAGTGNSLGRDLGMTGLTGHSKLAIGPAQAVDMMLVRFTSADGEAHQRRSASTLCVGYAAKTTANANLRFKHWGSRWCYPLAALVTVFDSPRQTFCIRYNGQSMQSKSLTGLMLTNTRHTGNFVCLPGTSACDGKAEAIETHVPPLRQLLHNVAVMSKTYFYDPAPVTLFTQVEVEMEQAGLLMLDGEIYADVSGFNVELLPGALKFHAGLA